MPRKITAFYRRFGLMLLVAAVAIFPFAVAVALKELATSHTHVPDWVPAGHQETVDLVWFIQYFGTDEILVLSWEDCHVDTECLPGLAERLLQPPDGVGQAPPLYRQVYYGKDSLDQLMSDPINLSREEAIERLKGWMIGADGKTTCLVAMISDAGMKDRPAAVRMAKEAVEAECGIPPQRLHIGGPMINSVEVDRASMKSLEWMVTGATIGCLAMAWLSLRSWLLTLVVFLTSEFNQVISLTLMYYTGRDMNAILIMVPTLVFVLSISASIHVVNYYLDAVRHRGWETASGQAVLSSWVPCCLAAMTTAVGLGSLMLGELTPIQQFGRYSAASVLVALVLLFLLLPSALQWSAPLLRRSKNMRDLGSREARSGRTPWKMRPLARFAIRGHAIIVPVGLLMIIAIGYGTRRIETSVALDSLFRPNSKVMRDYNWLEETFGGLVPVEIVLRFKSDCRLSMLDRLTVTAGLQRRIKQLKDVDAVISAATFAPNPPTGTGARQAIERRLIGRRLEKHRPELLESSYLREATKKGPGTDDEELWRITARVKATEQVDFEPFMNLLRSEVAGFLKEKELTKKEGVDYLICGGVPLIDSAQRQLLQDLIHSALAAFGLIALVMLVILRRFRGALLSMVPNVFPVFLVFGIMGWGAFDIDIGVMMTASVALGIAVDDTLHFLTWFQRSLATGHGRKAAAMLAFRRCGAAMTETSLVCGLGMFAFAFSSFVPTARFSWVLAASLGAALLGDLLLLPALLVGPLGRVFQPRN